MGSIAVDVRAEMADETESIVADTGADSVDGKHCSGRWGRFNS